VQYLRRPIADQALASLTLKAGQHQRSQRHPVTEVQRQPC
jgi:hypothetical protein